MNTIFPGCFGGLGTNGANADSIFKGFKVYNALFMLYKYDMKYGI